MVTEDNPFVMSLGLFYSIGNGSKPSFGLIRGLPLVVLRKQFQDYFNSLLRSMLSSQTWVVVMKMSRRGQEDSLQWNKDKPDRYSTKAGRMIKEALRSKSLDNFLEVWKSKTPPSI
ncbi:hypothetical protein ACFE04_021414 [Oxalis oulophora]